MSSSKRRSPTNARSRAENLKTALQSSAELQASSSRDELKQALAEAQQRADEAVKESVTAARVRERELEMAAISRLLESIRGLDGASSLSEVLDALGQAAGARSITHGGARVAERTAAWMEAFGFRRARRPTQADRPRTCRGRRHRRRRDVGSIGDDAR